MLHYIVCFLKVDQTVSQSVISNSILTHTKPSESLIRLVQLAITSSDEQKMTLQQIKDWLKEKLPLLPKNQMIEKFLTPLSFPQRLFL